MRVIHKNRTGSAVEAVDLLTTLFAVELLYPSLCVWLVSPWVSDIPLIDNRRGNFPALEPFGSRTITLSEILVALAELSTEVVIATRKDPLNDSFIARLSHLADRHNVRSRVCIKTVPQDQRLHDKALVGDDFVIAGSMNFTYSGALLNEEQIQLHTDPVFVAQTQMDLHARFGGRLS